MKIEIIINGIHYDCVEIDTRDMVTGKHYIFYGISWYELIKSKA